MLLVLIFICFIHNFSIFSICINKKYVYILAKYLRKSGKNDVHCRVLMSANNEWQSEIKNNRA